MAQSQGAHSQGAHSSRITSALRLGGLVFLVYLGLAVALFHGAWAAPSTRLIGACCDSAAYVDTLHITGSALFHGHNPLFSRLMHAPHGFNVMWQPNVLPLLGIVLTPLEALLRPAAVYDIAATLALAVSGWAAFVALRRWVPGRIGPFAGGLFFAFSPTMTAHSLGHLQITFAPFLPLAFLLASEILFFQRRPAWQVGVLFGVVLAAQLLIGEEILADTLISLGVLGVVAVLRFPRAVRTHTPYAASALGIGAVTAGVLAAGPALMQFHGPQQVHGAIRDTLPFGTNLGSLVVPVPQTTELATSWTVAKADLWFTGLGFSQTTAYIGIPLLVALAVLVVVKRRSLLVQVTVLTGTLVGVLSLGTQLHVASHTYDVWLPWRLVRLVPPFRSILPTTIFIVVDLALAVLVAYAVQASASAPGRWRAIGLAGIAAALVPLLPTFHYDAFAVTPVPRFFTTSQVDVIPRGATVLMAPYPLGSTPSNSLPMIWQAESGLRFAMLGGNVFVPGPTGGNTLGGVATPLTSALDAIDAGMPPPAPQTPALVAEERRELAADGVRAVVLGPMPGRAAALQLLEQVAGTPTASVGGVVLWTHLPWHRG